MADIEKKDIKAKEKQEVRTSAEQVKPGPVFTPTVDIFETENDITLLADLPGVTAEYLNIDLRDDTLTISGDVEPEATDDGEEILREYEVGQYVRKFTLSEVIDQSKINAQLNDGVLRLHLPKVEKAQPRKIAVNSG